MSLAPLRSPLSTHRRKDLVVCMGKVKNKKKEDKSRRRKNTERHWHYLTFDILYLTLFEKERAPTFHEGWELSPLNPPFLAAPATRQFCTQHFGGAKPSFKQIYDNVHESCWWPPGCQRSTTAWPCCSTCGTLAGSSPRPGPSAPWPPPGWCCCRTSCSPPSSSYLCFILLPGKHHLALTDWKAGEAAASL